MARLIVIEGPDKVGKETQSVLLEQRLADAGLKVIRVEPTKASHPRGKKAIYGMLNSGEAKRRPNKFQFVQFLNRMYFQFFKLPALMRDNDIVILDRWALSGYVYGKCEGINRFLNWAMYKMARRPDRVIVLLGHCYKRDMADDSYERDTDLQHRVRNEYERRANLDDGLTRVDNRWSVAEVNDDIIERLRMFRIIK